MAIFQYKFKSLLKFKEQLENQAKNELAKAYQILNNEIASLEILKDKLNSLIEEFTSVAEKSTIAKLKEYSSYIEYVEDGIEEQKNIVNQARDNVDISKRRVVESMRQRKVFEKLKEKHYEEYVKDEFRKEQRITDEIFNHKINSRKKEDDTNP